MAKTKDRMRGHGEKMVVVHKSTRHGDREDERRDRIPRPKIRWLGRARFYGEGKGQDRVGNVITRDQVAWEATLLWIW